MKHTALILLVYTVLIHPAKADPASDLKTAMAELEWIHNSIKYVASPEVVKTPMETLVSHEGDCADMSWLLLYQLEQKGITGAEMIILEMYQSHPPRHAIVKLWGVYFDTVSGMTFTDDFPLPHKALVGYDFMDILFDWRQSK
tara:strand:+ start:640 stop:1068 length:429 start_codon:yes stop_codon:yes gene_type:complete